MTFWKKLFDRKDRDVTPIKHWPTWLLASMVIFCFPALLWLSQLVPVGLEFLKIVNNSEVVWDFPTWAQMGKFTLVFLIAGCVALPLFVFSGACSTVLINRAIGDDARPNS